LNWIEKYETNTPFVSLTSVSILDNKIQFKTNLNLIPSVFKIDLLH